MKSWERRRIERNGEGWGKEGREGQGGGDVDRIYVAKAGRVGVCCQSRTRGRGRGRRLSSGLNQGQYHESWPKVPSPAINMAQFPIPDSLVVNDDS